MEVQLEGSKGVLPSFVARSFEHVLVLNTPLKQEQEELANYLPCDSYTKRLHLQLYAHIHFPEHQYGKKEIESVIPIALDTSEPDQEGSLLFLPPRMWTTYWVVKKSLFFYGDNTIKIKLLGDIPDDIPEPSKQEAYERACDTCGDMEWMEYQAKQKEIAFMEDELVYKNVKLHRKSIGHFYLLKRLEQEGYMFTFEAPFVLPGDDKSPWQKRIMDLMVFANQTAVIIEIDGSQHGEWKQRGDDYERDALIGKHWLKTRRFRHSDCVHNLDAVMETIRLMLDPRTNTSAL